jgi:hypothetical protein
MSGVIAQIPAAEVGLIFVEPSLKDEATKKVQEKLDELLADK